MGKIRIGLVEDEVIIADDLQALLVGLGYDCADPCGTYEEAIEMLETCKPELAILDINIGSKRDGIDVAKYIRANFDIPFIFLTASSDVNTVARARETLPNAYLVKPFQKEDLYTAIEVAVYNFNHQNKVVVPDATKAAGRQVRDSLFIKEGDYFHKVRFDDILYLSSEHVYVTVHTEKRKYLVRSSMQEFLEGFDASQFIRVHRSYVVNINKVEKINTSTILLPQQLEVPLSKNCREELLKSLHVI